MRIEELNQMVMDGRADEFIRVCEARQNKMLSRIADTIAARGGVRVVLIAGPSSAGKTTTAKRLATQIRVNGVEALHCSTDDYFVGDSRNPRASDGSFDYETIEAVDTARLAEDVNALIAGKPTYRRRFDFQLHEGYDAPMPTQLAAGGCLVLEGLHALNPRLSEGIPESALFRVFVEPTTQPEIIPGMLFHSQDARLLRRLVRDNQFRKLSPAKTFELWPKVLAGEHTWIDPFRKNADVTFDSALAYELGVLKVYVTGLLSRVLHENPQNEHARYLMTSLADVVPISPISVPGDSILRETIGSSQLDYT